MTLDVLTLSAGGVALSTGAATSAQLPSRRPPFGQVSRHNVAALHVTDSAQLPSAIQREVGECYGLAAGTKRRAQGAKGVAGSIAKLAARGCASTYRC